MLNLRLSASVLLCLTIVGCASLPRLSSGPVGCPADEITIANDKMGWSSRTWEAHCRGKTFYCSAHQSGENGSQVTCNPGDDEATASAPTPVQAGGCQYDTQCKGDRVCTDGRCVAPAQTSGGEARNAAASPPAWGDAPSAQPVAPVSEPASE